MSEEQKTDGLAGLSAEDKAIVDAAVPGLSGILEKMTKKYGEGLNDRFVAFREEMNAVYAATGGFDITVPMPLLESLRCYIMHSGIPGQPVDRQRFQIVMETLEVLEAVQIQDDALRVAGQEVPARDMTYCPDPWKFDWSNALAQKLRNLTQEQYQVLLIEVAGSFGFGMKFENIPAADAPAPTAPESVAATPEKP